MVTPQGISSRHGYEEVRTGPSDPDELGKELEIIGHVLKNIHQKKETGLPQEIPQTFRDRPTDELDPREPFLRTLDCLT